MCNKWNHRAWPLVFAVTAILLLSCACGTKKNTPVSRQWQAFTTRYNVYFNGKNHYDEQLKSMESDYQDDYTRMTLIHPAEAHADEKRPKPNGSFDRTIEKMQKSIQLHSIKKKPAKKGSSEKEKAFRARDEFNPFLHNAWLTMGKAQYYNGDFAGAASTFLYISKHFKWLPEVITEARLWMALCYCALDWNYEAENALHLVKEKELTNRNLRNLYCLAQGDYYVRTEDYAKAVPFLAEAAKYARGSQKNRLWFLLGQLYSTLGRKKDAYNAFKKAGAGVSTDYRTKFNARIKRSEVFEGGNIAGEVRSLKGMTRYARNEEYLDQIYYAIGNLYLSRKDTVNALENYRTAVEKSKRNGIDKALAQLALGNLYFEKGEYVKAQPCYAEAVPQLPESYPNYKTLRLRSDVLDQLALYAGNVELQDSLLTLARMTPEEQQAVAERLANEYTEREKKEAEEAKRAEYLAEQEGRGNDAIKKDEGPATNMMPNADKSWYFYNTMTKNQGKTEFQRRWGARKLEDDWRRRNKTTFSLTEPEEDDEGGDGSEGGDQPDSEEAQKEKEAAEAASDPHKPEYYLAQIPKTEEEIAVANDVIQEGLYNMGLILKDRLEDYPAARKEFDRLLERYPDNIYRLDVYYNMYLMAVRRGETAVAETWRRKILEDFPDSPYGKAMLDPNYFENLKRMNEIQESMYEKAYDAYLSDRNAEVHSLTEKMEADYPLSQILPKFIFIDALSYLTEDNPEKFKEQLTALLERYPDTDMTDVAGAIMRGLNAGRTPKAGLTNSRGMIWDLRLSNDTTSLSADGQPANFERNPDAPQYLVLAFPRDSVNANLVLYDVARFNFSSFVVKDFDLEPMSFGNIGLLVIKGFENMRQLEHYRTVMTRNGFELPEGVRPIMISKANFELLLREGRSFEEYFRFEEETPPDDLPPVEAPDEAGEPGEETGETAAPGETTESESPDGQPAAENAEEPAESTGGEGAEPAESSEEPAESPESEGAEPAENAEPAEGAESTEGAEPAENYENTEINP